MVRAVRECVSVPVIVGGGIKTPSDAGAVVRAGASFVVTGEIIEKQGNVDMLRDFTAAVHTA
jgi:putative glycerol-1-phosphate prenyltransferase